jgi:hypothetical protein
LYYNYLSLILTLIIFVASRMFYDFDHIALTIINLAFTLSANIHLKLVGFSDKDVEIAIPSDD